MKPGKIKSTDMIKIDLRGYKTNFLAEYFEVTRITVYNWGKAGGVPARYSQKLVDLLVKK